MASPQLENGFTRIANEMLEAIPLMPLRPYQSGVFWTIFRKTYGWGKKEDWISGSQFSAALGGVHRANAFRAIKGLVDKNMIAINKDDPRKPKYSIQEDISKWRFPTGAVVSTDYTTAIPVVSTDYTSVVS